ncbi:MAG: FAD-dependent oxidoreductase [Candidatus Bathyarchaeia archaeon]
MKFITEKERQTPITSETDVVVAGGGVAGVAAAVAAARKGAKVQLIERYGQLGGLATGGLVTLLLGYGRYEFGINREIGEYLLQRKLGAVESAGERVWLDGMGLTSLKRIRYDGEEMKFLLNKMVLKENIQLLFHSLIVDVIKEDDEVRGLILEGKSGRHAILGKIVIDATGDGDVLAGAGAEYVSETHPWGISLSHRFGNVDLDKTSRFQKENEDRYNAIRAELERVLGFKYWWGPSSRQNITLSMAPHILGYNVLDVNDLTCAEIQSRRIIGEVLMFLRENLPGFENAFVLETAPQLGIRAARRLVGEYALSKEEILAGARFEDAVIRSIYDVPYGCLMPKQVDNLLVAGRCVSGTKEGQEELRLICPCIATGQAAGTAAALSLLDGVQPRHLDVGRLQAALKKGTFP